MNDRRSIARRAMSAALRTRLASGYGLEEPICVYDLAEKLGIEVRFLDLPSMEGMYAPGSPPSIIVSSRCPGGAAHSRVLTSSATTTVVTVLRLTSSPSIGASLDSTRRSSRPIALRAPS